MGIALMDAQWRLPDVTDHQARQMALLDEIEAELLQIQRDFEPEFKARFGHYSDETDWRSMGSCILFAFVIVTIITIGYVFG